MILKGFVRLPMLEGKELVLHTSAILAYREIQVEGRIYVRVLIANQDEFDAYLNQDEFEWLLSQAQE